MIRRFLHRNASDDRDRGAVLPLVALVLGALITMTALTIDIGRQEVLRRDLQAAADVISIDLAHHLDGRTRSAIETSTTAPTWLQLKTYSAQRNNIDPTKVNVDLGIIDLTKHTDYNLSTSWYQSAAPTEVPTAVKVTITDNLNYFFAIGSGSATRSAVTGQNAQVCFDVGSYALGLNTASSTLFGQLFGSMFNGSLSLVGYQGLAGANLTLLQLLSSQSQVGTVDALLAESMTFGQFRVLMINALNNSGQTAAANVLNGLNVTTAQSNSQVSLGNIIAASQGTNGSAASAAWNVLDLFAGAAFLSNGTNFLSIPNLGITVPGLISAALTNFYLIQKPAEACSPRVAQTSQASVPLSIDVQVNACQLTGVVTGLSSLLGATTCLLGGVSLQTAHIDLTFNIAASTGTLSSVACSGGTKTATINVQSNLIVPHANVTILGLTALNADLSSSSQSAGGNVTFTVPPDAVPSTKSTGSGQLGFDSLTFGGTLGTVLDPIVDPLLQALKPQLFGPLGDSLGLRIAGADVKLISLDCNHLQLVG